MGAGEEQPEAVVVDGAERLGGPESWSLIIWACLLLVVALALPAEPVEGLVAGGGGEPAAGVGRYAVGGPVLDGDGEGLGRRLLGDVEVAEAPGEGGHDPGPLVAVDPGDDLVDVVVDSG